MENVIVEDKIPKKRKGGRPRKNVKMDELIGVKCTFLEKRAIISNAKKVKLTPSEFLRNLGLERRIDIHLRKTPPEVLPLTALLNHMNAGLNQVAKKKNKDEPFDALERANFLVLARNIKNTVELIKNYYQ